MENRSHALAAGLFIVVLVAALAGIATWMSGETVVRLPYLLVSQASVSGLNPQAAVRYRGVEVGKVETIRFDPANPRDILVRIAVDASVKLPKGTYAQLGYQGVTGLAYVQLEDDGKGEGVLATSRAQPTRIAVRPSFFDQVSASGQTLLASVNETALRVNALLSEDNRRELAAALAGLAAAARRADALMAGLEPGAKALPGVVSEAGVVLKRADLLLARLNADDGPLARASGGVAQVGSASREVGDAIAGSAVPKLVEASDSMVRTARGLERVAAGMEEEPQSLLFGRSAPPPGPGEPGFSFPSGAAR